MDDYGGESKVAPGDCRVEPVGGQTDAHAAYAVVGYVPSKKAKARLVCEAFASGASGTVRQPPPARLMPGAAAFFGVIDGTQQLWQQARAEGRDWYYLDNSYFDVVRGRLYRATRNAVQAGGRETPDWARWAALGVEIRPWQRQGRHIVLIAQSETYMRVVAGHAGCWWRDTLAVLAKHTDRPIVVRGWRANKAALAVTLKDALRDCWALVTWSSAAANEALLAGVPVFAAGPCAASPMALSDLTRIETPAYPEGRVRWAAALGGRQWTLDEFRDGTAWRTLHGLG
ncbi:MAG: hypothetical protein WDN28_04440 [Chthoniobacter sp.]